MDVSAEVLPASVESEREGAAATDLGGELATEGPGLGSEPGEQPVKRVRVEAPRAGETSPSLLKRPYPSRSVDSDVSVALSPGSGTGESSQKGV